MTPRRDRSQAREWQLCPSCGKTFLYGTRPRSGYCMESNKQVEYIRVREVLPRRAATTKRRKT